MASARGRSLQWSASQRVATKESRTPRVPPAAQISRLSAICSPMSMSRLPPNAPRTASSLRRAALRATSRLETFRQAISSMHPTAHSRTTRGVFTSCVTSSRIGRRRASSATGADSISKMDLILQRAHFVHCGRGAYPGPEPRDHMALMHVVPGILARLKSRGIRHPHLHPGIGVGEPAGQYADHLVGRAIQPYLLANDGGVSGEAPLEEAPREQNHVVGSNSDLPPAGRRVP